MIQGSNIEEKQESAERLPSQVVNSVKDSDRILTGGLDEISRHFEDHHNISNQL